MSRKILVVLHSAIKALRKLIFRGVNDMIPSSNGFDDNSSNTTNKQYLIAFEEWLSRHIHSYDMLVDYLDCIEIYLEKYLSATNVDVRSAAYKINHYIDCWLPDNKECSARVIKRHISAIKHFYNFLHDEGVVDSNILEEVQSTIKSNSQKWLSSWQ